MKKSDILKQERAALIDSSEQMVKKAEKENRELNATEDENFKRNLNQVQSLNIKIKNQELEEAKDKRNALRKFEKDNGKKRNSENDLFGKKQKIQISDEFRGVTIGSMISHKITGQFRNDSEKRAVLAGVDAQGGYTVPFEVGAKFIDSVREKTRIFEAGALISMHDTGQKGSVGFAKVTTPPNASFYAEAAPIVDATLVFGQAALDFKNLIVKIPVSNDFVQDTVNGMSILDHEINKAFQNKIDQVALFGLAVNNEPVGMDTWSGIQEIDALSSSPFTNYSHLVQAVTKLKQANFNGATAALLSPTLWGLYAGLNATDGQPLNKPEAIKNLPLLDTSGIGDAYDVGGDDTTKMFVGDFSKLIVGIRSNIEIKIFDNRNVNNTYDVWAMMRLDIIPEHENAFVKVHSIKMS